MSLSFGLMGLLLTTLFKALSVAMHGQRPKPGTTFWLSPLMAVGSLKQVQKPSWLLLKSLLAHVLTWALILVGFYWLYWRIVRALHRVQPGLGYLALPPILVIGEVASLRARASSAQ